MTKKHVLIQLAPNQQNSNSKLPDTNFSIDYIARFFSFSNQRAISSFIFLSNVEQGSSSSVFLMKLGCLCGNNVISEAYAIREEFCTDSSVLSRFVAIAVCAAKNLDNFNLAVKNLGSWYRRFQFFKLAVLTLCPNLDWTCRPSTLSRPLCARSWTVLLDAGLADFADFFIIPG